MNSIKIRTPEIGRIVFAIRTRSAVPAKLRENLFNISLGLNVTDEDWDSKKIQLTIGQTTAPEVLRGILAEWVSKKNDDASLAVFLEVLKKFELNDFISAVKEEFKAEIGAIEPLKVQQPNSESMISDSDPVCLNFGNQDVNLVLQKIGPDLVKLMYNEETNKQIILQLGALQIFENLEIQPLLGNFPVEQTRVIGLLNLLQNQGSQEIKQCFEKLCNLENMPRKRKDMRALFARFSVLRVVR